MRTSAARADMLDSMVRGLSHEEAERRAIRRRRAEAQSGGYAGGYSSADRRRNWSDWEASVASANFILSREFETVRARARERERNDAYASSAINEWVDHAIGSSLRPQIRVNAARLGVSEAVADEWNKRLEEEFHEWASEPVDLEQNLDFTGVAKQSVRRMGVDGEYFAQQVVRDGYVCIEAVDAERVTDPTLDIRKGVTAGGSEVLMGIERAGTGRLVAYWVASRGLIDVGTMKPRAWMRVPRRDGNGVARFMHCFDPNNSGQLRGISVLSPALRYLKLIDDVLETELFGQRAAASYGLIREREVNAQTLLEDLEDEDDEIQLIKKLSPVMDIEGLPGEKIKMAERNRPGNSFEPFIHRALVSVAAGTSMPVHQLANDFSKVNYSSGKLGQQKFLRRIGSHFRGTSLRTVGNPILRGVAVLAWANGRLPNVPLLENLAGWTRCTWFAQGHDWVEVLKEAQAEQLAVNGNLKTLQEVCASRGHDWQDVLRQRAIEKQMERELGIEPPASQASSLGKPANDEEEREDEEGEDGDTE